MRTTPPDSARKHQLLSGRTDERTDGHHNFLCHGWKKRFAQQGYCPGPEPRSNAANTQLGTTLGGVYPGSKSVPVDFSGKLTARLSKTRAPDATKGRRPEYALQSTLPVLNRHRRIPSHGSISTQSTPTSPLRASSLCPCGIFFMFFYLLQ